MSVDLCLFQQRFQVIVYLFCKRHCHFFCIIAPRTCPWIQPTSTNFPMVTLFASYLPSPNTILKFCLTSWYNGMKLRVEIVHDLSHPIVLSIRPLRQLGLPCQNHPYRYLHIHKSLTLIRWFSLSPTFFRYSFQTPIASSDISGVIPAPVMNTCGLGDSV